MKYKNLDVSVDHSLNMVDRQEFDLVVRYKEREIDFFLEGFRKDVDQPVVWLLHISGTTLSKKLEDMRDETLYNTIIGMIEDV